MSNLSIALTGKVDGKKRTTRRIHVMQDITSRVDGLEFSTDIIGGFMTASMRVLVPPSLAQLWYEQRFFQGIQINEGDQPTWEGRITTIKIVNGGVELGCEGYWASLADQQLYVWYNDNDLGKWLQPAPGAGGISDDISLDGSGEISKFQIAKSPALVSFSTVKDTKYEVGDIALIYYRLTDVTGISELRPFGPWTIHSIQFTWDNSTIHPFDLVVWTADVEKGTWQERHVFRPFTEGIDPGVVTVDLVPNGERAQVIGLGIKCIYPFEEDLETGERRIAFSTVTIYAENDATVGRLTTSKKIITDLVNGNPDTITVAHGIQVSDDLSALEESPLELVPAIFEGETVQDIIGKILEYGIGVDANLVDNPSLEVDAEGWSGPSGDRVASGAYGSFKFNTTTVGAAGEGITILDRNGKRFPVIEGETYTFSLSIKATIALKALDLSINWYGIGADIFTFTNSTLGSTDTLKASTSISKTTFKYATRVEFDRVKITATAPAGATGARLELLTSSNQGVFGLDADAARFIKGEESVYIDGTRPGGSWAGIAHQSKTVKLTPALAGVYGNRRLHMRARDESKVKWVLSMRELGEGGAELERNINETWGRVWGRFTEVFTGTDKFVDAKRSSLSESVFHTERDIFLDLSDVTETFVDQAITSFINEHDRPRQKTDITLNGVITNSLGAVEPVWRVRAGDVFMITDIGVPFVVRSAASDRVDRLRTFVIKETDYDDETGELRIVPDFAPDSLDISIARAGILPSIRS